MLTECDLRQFTGTEHYYRHWSRRLVYTDGVKYLAEEGGAYWLIDLIASHQKYLNSAGLREFQMWEIQLDGSSAVVTCRADSGTDPVVTQKVKYTDFPMDYCKLYVENGVILLPSEH